MASAALPHSQDDKTRSVYSAGSNRLRSGARRQSPRPEIRSWRTPPDSGRSDRQYVSLAGQRRPAGATIGNMSEPDAVPLPREGEVFFDVRGESRTMRLSWYADSSVAVFSIWQGNRCTGTFRLPFGDLVRMVETLQAGPPSPKRRSGAWAPGRAGLRKRALRGRLWPSRAGRLRSAGPLWPGGLVTAQARITKPAPVTARSRLRIPGRLRRSGKPWRSTRGRPVLRRLRTPGGQRGIRPTGRLWRAAPRPRRCAALPSRSARPAWALPGNLYLRAFSAPRQGPRLRAHRQLRRAARVSRVRLRRARQATPIRPAAPSQPVILDLPVGASTTTPTTTQVIATGRPSSSRHLQNRRRPIARKRRTRPGTRSGMSRLLSPA